MAFDYTNVRVLPILIAGVAFMMMGGLWYGPLFAKSWMALIGKTEAELQAGMAGRGMGLMYGGAFLASLVASYVLALVIEATMMTTAMGGACVGLLTSLGFVGTAFASGYIFNQKPVKLWFIDVGYQVVCFVIAGAIIGGWR